MSPTRLAKIVIMPLMALPNTLKARPNTLPIIGAKVLYTKEAIDLNNANRGASFSWLSLIVEVTLLNAAWHLIGRVCCCLSCTADLSFDRLENHVLSFADFIRLD
jgi:hypothetical protein